MDNLLTETWMLKIPALDSQDLFVLLTHALDMTLGHIPFQHHGSCVTTSTSHVRVENQEMLSAMGARNLFCR